MLCGLVRKSAGILSDFKNQKLCCDFFQKNLPAKMGRDTRIQEKPLAGASVGEWILDSHDTKFLPIKLLEFKNRKKNPDFSLRTFLIFPFFVQNISIP